MKLMRRGRNTFAVRTAAVIATGATVVALSAAPSEAALATRSISFSAPSSTTTGAAITVSGTVTHSPKGTVVQIERQSGRTWVLVSTVHTTTTTGHYSSRFAVPRTHGTYVYMAVSPATRTLARVASAHRSVVVRLPSTATLVSPVRTATNGQTVTLSGKVTPWIAHRPVSLQRRVLPATAWSTLSSLSPGSTGAWTKHVVPANNAITQYRVVAPTYSYVASATSPTVAIATPPVIATATIADATLNTAYTQSLGTTDHRAGTWTVTTGTLPTGLSLSAAGVISGTPTVATGAGGKTFAVTFRDAFGLSATKQYTMSVDSMGHTPSAVQVSAGGLHTCRVSVTGVLQCWGDNTKGEIGIGADPIAHPSEYTPQTVTSAVAWQQVSTSPTGLGDDTCAIKVDHSLWCWGYDFYGEAGQSTRATYILPKQVLPGTHWTTVAVGGQFTCAVRTDGSLWCWGIIGGGSAGSAPAQVGTSTAWSSNLVAGFGHACAIDTSSHLWCWGFNAGGWVGNGTNTDVAAPTKIAASKHWTTIAAGPGNTCGVQSSGTLWCWGSDSNGQLANGNTTTSSNVPLQVGTSTSWLSVSVNGAGISDHVCAVDNNNAIYCWGSDASGEAGVAPTSNPDNLTGLHLFDPSSSLTWATVSAGGEHTCATSLGGNTYCWGDNANGQLGVGAAVTGAQSNPLPVP